MWSNKAVAPHPTISAVPLPDATLARLISLYFLSAEIGSFLCSPHLRLFSVFYADCFLDTVIFVYLIFTITFHFYRQLELSILRLMSSSTKKRTTKHELELLKVQDDMILHRSDRTNGCRSATMLASAVNRAGAAGGGGGGGCRRRRGAPRGGVPGRQADSMHAGVALGRGEA
ncbi:hypothetical protein H6S26_00900 [Escherichia coli]|nr:hypothetical protein H6S26_00900 [Escherichia coli]